MQLAVEFLNLPFESTDRVVELLKLSFDALELTDCRPNGLVGVDEILIGLLFGGFGPVDVLLRLRSGRDWGNHQECKEKDDGDRLGRDR